ncbi:MAG TPA: aldo/keto reductase [Allosphingosinicella sp.]|nr:aldo/keto reductase [Allosphingosinicella sp.]HKT14386.1 aldo/keto reductase [Allosphingosinicella sp.]
MDQRILGATGMSVSPLCLGAMMFGAMGNADHDECVRIIHRAIDAGINFIDTADLYSYGESEEIVAKAIKGRRDDLIVATKFYLPMSENPNHRGGSRKWIVRAVEDSLRRLGTDYVDLYQIHRFDTTTDLEEILFSLTELVRQGKVRSFGSSMFPADRIVEAQWTAEKRALLRFRCEQPWYSIFARDIERFVLPACQRYGMGVITWSPLDGGFLSGKYRGPQDFTDDSRIVKFAKRFRGSFDPQEQYIRRKLEIVEQLHPLAEEAGLTLAQLAVAFTLEHPGVTSSIIGPRTMDQLESLLPAAEARLAEDILDRIDALVPPGSTLNPAIDVPSATTKAALRRSR